MQLKYICCSLKNAIKFKELGIKQDAIFSYYIGEEHPAGFIEVTKEYLYPEDRWKKYSAFTAIELLCFLPASINAYGYSHTLTINKLKSKHYSTTYVNSTFNTCISENNLSDLSGLKSLNNSLSELLLYIIDKKYISLEKINERF